MHPATNICKKIISHCPFQVLPMKKLEDTSSTSAVEAAGVSSPGEVPPQHSMIWFHSRQSKFKAPIAQGKQLRYPSPLGPSTCVSGLGLTRTGADMLALHHANTVAARAFQKHKADCKEKSTQRENSPANCNLALTPAVVLTAVPTKGFNISLRRRAVKRPLPFLLSPKCP